MGTMWKLIELVLAAGAGESKNRGDLIPQAL